MSRGGSVPAPDGNGDANGGGRGGSVPAPDGNGDANDGRSEPRGERPSVPTPPENADDWSDEQWLEWLALTDRAAGEDHFAAQEPDGEALPGALERIAHSEALQPLGEAMRALHAVFYGEPEKPPAIVVKAGGDPGGDDPGLHLDLEHPERSTFVVPQSGGDASEGARAPSSDTTEPAQPPSADAGEDGPSPSADAGEDGPSPSADAGEDGR